MTSGQLSLWFEQLSENADAPIRLFIFPFAGGGSVAWRPWISLFPKNIDVKFVLLPGRERRFGEKPYTSLTDLLTALESEIRPLLDRPYALFGHSMGGAIAYELARRLSSLRRPEQLFVSGRRSPGRPRRTPRIFHLPDNEFIAALGKLGGTPPEILENKEMMELFLPCLRADFELSDSYEPLPGGTLDCPITVFGGTEDPEAARDDLEGWKDVTNGESEIEVFSGNHFFLSPHRQSIISTIRERLKL